MSTSRARNFRRRGDDDEDNTENTPSTVSAPAAATTTTTTTIKKPSSSKPKKLLSFADDEEEEQPSSNRVKSKPSSRLNKPSSSHKITSSKDRLPLLSNVQPQAGTYTKEALLELQKNTKTLAAPSSKPPPSSEPTIVLKGLLKPQNSTFVENNPARVSSDSDSDNKHETEKKFASMGIAKGKDLIPDKATIEAIRAKRERMRQSRGREAPDYISLEGGSDHRLGGDDLSDEEPEFPRRVAMFGEKVESGKKNIKKKGVFEDDDDEENERPVVVGNAGKINVEDDEYDDEDEVAKIWEEEQVRKGLGKRIDDSSATARVVSSATANVPMSQPPQVLPQKLYPTAAPPNIGGAIGGLQGFDTVSISQKGENAIKAVHDSINRLKVCLCLLVYFVVWIESHQILCFDCERGVRVCVLIRLLL